MSFSQPNRPHYRPDIDGLRAVAVWLVVGFHAFPSWVKAGFVGVDIFFVISGYLISQLIVTKLQQHTFSFLEFYARRVRRIFPALITILLTSWVFGWFALLAKEYQELGKHMASASVFISNWVLWYEKDYFDPAAITKPLLHLWSLAIEEQFYLIWPCLLTILWKKKWGFFRVTVVLMLLSFAINVATYQTNSVANFYSPFTRFWELLAGACLAYHPSSWPLNRHNHICCSLGAGFIGVSLLFITSASYFPGLWALLPVFGTAMIIGAGKQAFINRILLSQPVLVWFGSISFPLYLWHWPLLSFAHIVESNTPDRSIRISIVLLAIVLAWLTTQWIEQPLRFGKESGKKTMILLGAMTLTGLLGIITYQKNRFPFKPSDLQRAQALSALSWDSSLNSNRLCQKWAGDRTDYCQLQHNRMPTVALIGDSFANSYFPGLSKKYDAVGDNLVMLGKGGCPPLLDITSGFAGEGDWCHAQTSHAIEYIARLPQVHTVILAANWHLYIQGTRFYESYAKPWKIQSLVGNESSNAAVFLTQFRKTLQLLTQTGKKIIVIKQTPELNFELIPCVTQRPLTLSDPKNTCAIPTTKVKNYLAEYEPTLDKALRGIHNITVLDPLPILCPGESCPAMDGAFPLYRDHLHLSVHGSLYLARQLVL